MKFNGWTQGLAACAMWVVVGGTAWAQEAGAGCGELPDTACAAADVAPLNADGTVAADGSILVTGSRIRRDAFSSVEPMTVIGAQEIAEAGFASAAEAIQSLEVTAGAPQVTNIFAARAVMGGIGVNTISLRNLGPLRTLVLLNGRRLAPAGTRGLVGAADLNVLPTALVERIEVLKAGASSIYGSDAVSGVVNIITRSNLEGLYLDGQVRVPEAGAGPLRRVALSGGYRGNRLRFSASLDLLKRERLARSDRAFTRCPINGLIAGRGAELGSADYVDPRTGRAKCFPLDNRGVTVNTLGVSLRPAVPAAGTGGTLFDRLRPNAAITTGVPGFEGVSRDSRDTFDPRMEEEDLVTPAEIVTGFVQSGYDIGLLGDAELYVELLGSRRESSALSYRQLSIDYPLGSPLIPQLFRNSVLQGPSETSSGLPVGVRAFVGFGNLETRQRVDYVRLGGGLRGALSLAPGWRYDLFVGKTWTDAGQEAEDFLTDRLTRATAVRRNPDGSFSCTAALDPACVPAPLLTPAVIGGALPQPFRDYIVADLTGTTRFRESTGTLSIDGPLLALPGGSAQLVLGAEYRHARIDDTPPTESQAGNILSVSAARPTRGSDSVWEGFGELHLPLLADVPFAHRLNATGSVRYTDYDSYGGDTTYKLVAEWHPMAGLGLRGSYGTSYRAPALFEQFLGATSGFRPALLDPCNRYGMSPSAARRANCAAEGLAPDFIATAPLEVLSGGGAATGLEAETSTNWTVGAIVEPQLPQAFGALAVSLDYFDIEVRNGVSQAGESNILARCYGSTSDFADDEGFCRLVSRNPVSRRLTINDNYFNLVTDVTRGFELNVRYARALGPAELLLEGIVTKYEEQSKQLFPGDDKVDFSGIVTVPEWTGSGSVRLSWQGWSLRYGLDWIGGDDTRTYAFAGEEPGMRILEVPDYFLHHLSLGHAAPQGFSFKAGVRNLFDRDPPRVSTSFGRVYNTVANAPLYSGYDFVGRQLFVSASARF